MRPCDKCGGPVVPTHYRVKIETMVVDPAACRERVGMAKMLGNQLAAVFDSHGNSAVKGVPYGRAAVVCPGCLHEVSLGEVMSFCEEPSSPPGGGESDE